MRARFFAAALGALSAAELGAAAARAEPKPLETEAEPKFTPPPFKLRPDTLAYFELGSFGGLFFPSPRHELLSKGPFEPYKSPATELGARVGFFPVRYAGVELEGAGMFTQTERGDPAGLWSARAHVVGRLPLGRVRLFGLFGFGMLGATSNTLGEDADPAFHFGLGARLALDRYFSVRFDCRDTLSQKHGAAPAAQTHHPELLLGLSFTLRPAPPRSSAPPPPLPDADGDGAPDEFDSCPHEVGVPPNGCPPRDSDGDGLSDDYDVCPNEPGPRPHGCPPSDSDGDLFVDELDRCPTEPGPNDGCPDPDPDRDGIVADSDRCPDAAETFNDFEDDDGCPDTVPEELQQLLGVLPDVDFERGKSTLDKRSVPIIRAVSAALARYPSVRLRVIVRPRPETRRATELALLTPRAQALVDELVRLGVARERLATEVAPALPTSAPLRTGYVPELSPRIELRLLPEHPTSEKKP